MGATFLTATGTDIGKTYLACALIKHLREAGQPVDALKPVATGFDPAEPDTTDAARLLTALGRPVSPDEIARISPWRYRAPLAPNLAARREGRTLDFEALVEFSRKATRDHRGTLLIEGIGGVMVPLAGRHTVLDWIGALAVPVILVCGSYLGALSHALTSLEVLRQRRISVHAIVVNETPDATVTVAETVESLAGFADPVPVISVAHQIGDSLDSNIGRLAALLY